MYPYDYVAAEPQFTLQRQQSGRYSVAYDVAFPTAHPSPYQPQDTAHGEYRVPAIGNRFPLVILLHGLGTLGEKQAVPSSIMAQYLARGGMASFAFRHLLPAQYEEGKKRGLAMPYVENWMELIQVLVINIRQVIDWAETREELDTSRIAVIGISTGGMASAIAMAIDKRISAGVFMIIAGNMEKILWEGSTSSYVNHQCSRSQCHEIYSHYPQYLAEVAEKGIENVTPAKECFLFDSITFAPLLCGRPMLMINAVADDFAPGDAVMELWQACGRPRIVWLTGTHQTAFLQYHSPRREIINFLRPVFHLPG